MKKLLIFQQFNKFKIIALKMVTVLSQTVRYIYIYHLYCAQQRIKSGTCQKDCSSVTFSKTSISELCESASFSFDYHVHNEDSAQVCTYFLCRPKVFSILHSTEHSSAGKRVCDNTRWVIIIQADPRRYRDGVGRMHQ